MNFNDHLDILLYSVLYAKTKSFDAFIKVSRLEELKDTLKFNLSKQYELLIKEYGDLVDYFFQIQAPESEIYDDFFNLAKEGFQIMSQFDYYADSRGLAPLSYNLKDSKNCFVFLVLPYNKNRILQELKKEKQRELELEKERKIEIIIAKTTTQDIDLEEEIIKLYKNYSMSGRERDNRLELKDRINTMVNNVWPNKGYKVVIFGSSANGLGVDEGDLDLCITGPGEPPKMNERKYRMDMQDIYDMDYLELQLKRIGMERITAITKAYVPICRFYDPKSGLSVDINANAKLGIENTRLIKQYTKLDARVGPFLFAIKYFVSKKGLNDAYGGTLSSYTYHILGLHYLMCVLAYPVIPSLQVLKKKCKDPLHCNFRAIGRLEGYDIRYHDCVQVVTDTKYQISNPNGRFDCYTEWYGENTDNLGTLIRDFFRWCSDEITIIQPISIISNDGFPCDVEEYKWKKDIMIIQDPFIVTKNIGHPCSELGLKRMIDQFKIASDKMDKDQTSFEHICNSEFMDF